MIILGLGSNIGDRLQYLRQALTAIKNLPHVSVQQVSPLYLSSAQLPDHAPPEWNQHFINCAVRCESTLSPHELLAVIKKIELDVGRDVNNQRWSPRVLDIDILAWDQNIIETPALTVPHPHLLTRPFALWPLTDVAPLWNHPVAKLTAEQLIEPWGSRFSAEAPFQTRSIQQRIDTPQLVGVINVTPDSFSDGGNFASAEQALHQAIHLVEAGAEILDIGAESTAPNSPRLTPDQEWQRLQPALASIMQARKMFLLPVKISVDTMHAATAQKSLAMGVDWINDVTGLQDPAMRSVLRESQADCVVMHHLSIPPTNTNVIPRDQHPADFLLKWGENHFTTLEEEGIARERIIFDPGLGFGKSAAQTLTLLQHIASFKQLGVRVLAGHSRKRFIAMFTPLTPAERDIETLTITTHLASQPVDYLRVHNVEISARALRVQAALRASTQPPYKTNQK